MRIFLRSCAFCLALASAAKLFSAAGSAKILDLDDPLLGVTNRNLMNIVGCCEFGGVVYLFISNSVVWRSGICLAFGINFSLYRIWSLFLGVKVCPCLGTLTDQLHLRPEIVDGLLWLFLIYMMAGSVVIMKYYSNNAGDVSRKILPSSVRSAT